MEIIIPYYEDNTRISNSAIGWFLNKGPQYLRDMLDNKEEGLSGKFLERGTMIHEYILQPEEFWKDYEILDFDTPKAPQQKTFCECYANLLSTEPLESVDTLKIKAYRSSYSNSKKDEVVLDDATKLVDTYTNYIKYLRTRNFKNIISFTDLNMLKNIKSNLENHVAAKELLWPEDVESHNEFHINWTHPYSGIDCKSLIDRVILDHKNKVVTLIDLKTTSDAFNFKHSVEEYDYYRQLEFYFEALDWYFTNELGINMSEYEKRAYIIAIQTNGNNQVRVFNMLNPEELSKRSEVISDALKGISYHINSGNWEHTREYYENDGIEELK